jgi:hypothetical protein
MIPCWLLFLLAIILCGSALAFMTAAAGWATHVRARNYWLFEYRALTGIIAIIHPSRKTSASDAQAAPRA